MITGPGRHAVGGTWPLAEGPSAPQPHGAPVVEPGMSAPQFRIEYPGLNTRYLVRDQHAGLAAHAAGADAYTSLASSLRADGQGVTVDGQPVPWYLADVPIQVDDDQGVRVVYLPVLIDGEVSAGPGVRIVRLGELLAEQPEPYEDGSDAAGAQGVPGTPGSP